MNERRLRSSLIGIAAFLHDIGKAYQRTGKQLPNKYKRDTFERQLLLNKDSHLHALHTAVFFDNFIANSLIEQIWKDCFPESDMLKTSAGHHNPEDFLTKIIAQADYIASGFDRERYEERQNNSPKDYRKVHLAPLLRHITLKKNDIDNSYRFKLEKLNYNSLFPVKKSEIEGENAEEKYKKLVNEFENDYSVIHQTFLSVEGYVDALQSLYEKYFSFVPASTWDDYDEVSLYDHSKTTAAFASAIYNLITEKQLTDKNPDFINSNENNFILLRGEFFGVQKFIFGNDTETNKNSAKILRGKSFYVSVLSEVAAYYFLEELNLPSFNLMLNAAGMFVILAPNTESTHKALCEGKKKLNDWLYNQFIGEVSLGIVTTEASAKNFMDKEFEQLWLNLLSELDKAKYAKFDLKTRKAVFENYHTQFDGKNTCKVCGKKAAVNENCDLCDSFEIIGKNLVTNRFLYIIHKNNGSIFNKFEIQFSNEIKPSGNILKVIDLNPTKPFSGASIVYLNSYIPKKNNAPMSFEEMVKINGHSESKPLGVLKADVDNLGAIFAVGLEPYKHESKMNYKLTFSRLSAMSRMINIFFAYYLPEICKKDYQNVYTVFAGGDDLFLIGPYDEIIELNFKINEDFKLFTGNNEDVTISSAIGLFKHNTPVVYMAEIVEENLKNAKSFSSDSFVKGQMSVLGVVEKPESFKDFYKRFTELLSKSSVKNNTSFWYKVMSFIDMKIKVSEDKKVNLINLMWLPRLKYSLARNIKDKVEREKMAEFLIKSIEENPKLLRAALSINLYKIRYGG